MCMHTPHESAQSLFNYHRAQHGVDVSDKQSAVVETRCPQLRLLDLTSTGW